MLLTAILWFTHTITYRKYPNIEAASSGEAMGRFIEFAISTRLVTNSISEVAFSPCLKSAIGSLAPPKSKSKRNSECVSRNSEQIASNPSIV